MSNVVPPSPHMDDEGLACFRRVLATTRCYLEYGSGGSTIYANGVPGIEHIVSAESDRRWAQAVAGSLDKRQAQVSIVHCDIGEVGKWGTPVDASRMDGFWRYMVAPWELVKKHDLVPDTILVDGRFRVASFLYSLLSARAGAAILFDDYLDRPEYSVVEQFCPLAERHGRMGLFRVSHDYSVPGIAKAIAQYSVVPR